jgi:hypothetical protein
MDAIGLFLFGGGVLGALGVLGWQIYEWMRSSTWISLPALAPLQWLDVPWALSPQHWLGVHQALSSTPLSIALLLVGSGGSYVCWILDLD